MHVELKIPCVFKPDIKKISLSLSVLQNEAQCLETKDGSQSPLVMTSELPLPPRVFSWRCFHTSGGTRQELTEAVRDPPEDEKEFVL